jgi:hypothetical protein
VNKRRDTGSVASGYVLAEENFVRLEKIRNQLTLLANFAMTITEEEEAAPLQIARNALGECLEGFALQIDDVLMTAEWTGHKRDYPVGKH